MATDGERSAASSQPASLAALTALYGGVRAFLLQRTRDPDLADDLAQDVYVRVLAKVGEGTAIEQPRAWLRRVAENVLRNHLRDRQRRVVPTVAVEDAGDVEDREVPGPLEAAVEREGARLGRDAVERALARLSPDNASLIRGLELEGRSTQEMAAELGISQGGVRSRRMRAMRRLVQMLGAEKGARGQ